MFHSTRHQSGLLVAAGIDFCPDVLTVLSVRLYDLTSCTFAQTHLVPEREVREWRQILGPLDGHEEESGGALVHCFLARRVDGALGVGGGDGEGQRGGGRVVVRHVVRHQSAPLVLHRRHVDVPVCGRDRAHLFFGFLFEYQTDHCDPLVIACHTVYGFRSKTKLGHTQVFNFCCVTDTKRTHLYHRPPAWCAALWRWALTWTCAVRARCRHLPGRAPAWRPGASPTPSCCSPPSGSRARPPPGPAAPARCCAAAAHSAPLSRKGISQTAVIIAAMCHRLLTIKRYSRRVHKVEHKDFSWEIVALLFPECQHKRVSFLALLRRKRFHVGVLLAKRWCSYLHFVRLSCRLSHQRRKCTRISWEQLWGNLPQVESEATKSIDKDVRTNETLQLPLTPQGLEEIKNDSLVCVGWDCIWVHLTLQGSSVIRRD